MKRRSITLTEEVGSLVAAQVGTGRFKDISTAVNALLDRVLTGSDAIYREYGVTPEKAAQSAPAPGGNRAGAPMVARMPAA